MKFHSKSTIINTVIFVRIYAFERNVYIMVTANLLRKIKSKSMPFGVNSLSVCSSKALFAKM